MTRPILWAAGMVVVIGVGAGGLGERLSKVAAGTQAGPDTTRSATAPQASIDRSTTILSDHRGHFVTQASIEGRWVEMLVDTGASIVALTSEDAAAIGLRPSPGEFTGRLSTANGTVQVARTRIREIRVGGISVRDVEAVIMPAGRLGVSLLGMSFLRQLRAFEVESGRLTLRS